MTKDEALRLALEFLESLDRNHWNDRQQAITAIKAALEAKVEPVACKECHLKDTVYDLLGDLKVANLKLSVKSQRTWVGLTDEEIQAEWLLTPQHDKAEGVWFGRRLEAKLKEKNSL
jgi:hypothetical protein